MYEGFDSEAGSDASKARDMKWNEIMLAKPVPKKRFDLEDGFVKKKEMPDAAKSIQTFVYSSIVDTPEKGNINLVR